MKSDLVESTLRETLKAMGAVFSDIQHEEIAGQSVFTVQVDADVARVIIGTHGDPVFALDHLVKKIVENRLFPRASTPNVEEGSNETHFIIDVNNHRSKQIKDLQAKALMMAERARSLAYDVELSPMSAYERLIVHTTLASSPNIKTESQGEGRSRRVVIRYINES